MASKKVVIGGGTGYIGSHLARILKSKGYTPICVSRYSERAPLTWKDIESNGLPKSINAVINVAGVNVFNSKWTESFKKEIQDSRIGTTKLLAKAMVDTRAKAFLTISGVGYYKPNNVVYTEDHKCEPYDFFSQLCHDWEAAARLPNDSKIRQVIIRSGVVLGKGSSIDNNMRPVFRIGLGGPIGKGSQYMPWIHIKDLVNMFVFSLENPNVSDVLNGVAPEIVTNKQFTAEYAKALDVFAFMSAPAFAVKLMFHKERAVMLLEGQKVSPKRPLLLGFRYEYPTIKTACATIG